MTGKTDGSSWAKWDLHLHSPSAWLSNEFGDWNAYLDTLAQSDVAVYGITNYFCFANNELEKVRDGLLQRGHRGVVLGNVEFRIAQPNRNGEYVNVHVLFSEKLGTAEINEGLQRIELLNTVGSQALGRYCSEEHIRSAGGFDKCLIDFQTLIDGLARNFQFGNYVVAACANGYGSMRPSFGEGRGAALATEIDKRCALVFGLSSNKEFYLSSTRYSGATPKAVIAGSDAHRLGEIGRNHTWIKGAPCFNGLRYVLREPGARVHVGGDQPPDNYAKPWFSALALSGTIFAGEALAFKDDKLKINRDMVALIGGRGEGKSVLLDALRRNLERPHPDDKKRFSKIVCEGFSVEWTKQDGLERLPLVGESQDQVQYLHVSQHELNSITDDHVKLSLEIRKLLGINDDDDWLDFDSSIQTVLAELKELNEWFSVQDAHGQSLHTRAYNDQIVTLNQRRIDALTVAENRASIDQFTIANSEASETSVLLDDVRGLVDRLEEIKREMTGRIEDLNKRLAGRSIVLSTPNYSDCRSTLDTAVGALVSNLAEVELRRDALLKRLEQKGLAGDASAVFEKTGLYQSSISAARARIKEIEVREARKGVESDRRARLIADCLESYQANADEISHRFGQLKKGKENWTDDQKALVAQLLAGVDVRGDIVFNATAFYEGLSELLNMRRFRISGGQTRAGRLQEVFGVWDYASFKQLVLGNGKLRLDADTTVSLDEFASMKDYLVKGTEVDLLSYIFRRKMQARYLTVSAAIEYQGRSPDKLSSGQRGTLFLCLKLATDPFGSPFVFDQPEDDLDNEFIVTQLVPLFRRIKRYRQVIIATHNANLVVNADAEQVVVASNVNERISFVTGGIEDPSIRREICRVLEGGEQAFRDREIKYGLRHSE